MVAVKFVAGATVSAPNAVFVAVVAPKVALTVGVVETNANRARIKMTARIGIRSLGLVHRSDELEVVDAEVEVW